MRSIAVTLFLPLALLAAAPAPAQPAEPESPASGDIVVTGTRDREEQVRDFVTALTPARSGAIARFIDEVCPTVSGLVPAQSRAVADRLRAVAGAAGLRVGGEDCAPNAFVIVTPSKRAFIEALSSKRPGSFGAMRPGQIRRLARAPGPAAAWHLEGPVDADGIPLPFDEALGTYRNDTVQGASRLRPQAGRGFDASALIVETGAIAGLTPLQLADYAAMRLLAKLDPTRLPDPAPPTILGVLTAPMGSPVPITMTNWDLGFLRGLYAGQTDLMPGARRSEIGRRVAREIDAPSADTEE